MMGLPQPVNDDRDTGDARHLAHKYGIEVPAGVDVRHVISKDFKLGVSFAIEAITIYGDNLRVHTNEQLSVLPFATIPL